MTTTDFIPIHSQECILNENCIDLWYFSLVSPLNLPLNILNEEELTRASRYYFAKHQRRFNIARTQLRLILARYLEEEPASLIFGQGVHGKPSVINNRQLEFNLSHTGDHALVAIGKNFALGVDIEQYSPRPYLALANQLFSKSEQKALKLAPLSYQAQLFFHLWTQKEAFIKACGLGLAYPTDKISLPVFSPVKTIITDPIYKKSWKMVTFMPQIALNAALCCHPTIETILYRKLDNDA